MESTPKFSDALENLTAADYGSVAYQQAAENRQTASNCFDGTPQVEVVDDVANIFDSIYEHRRGAKDRSESKTFSESSSPLNNSSFFGLEDGESELLYSKSSERDRAVLEEF